MKINKNQKTSIILLIILLLTVINSQSASSGCCTPPAPTTCFSADSDSACPGYYLDYDCTNVSYCIYNPGCCTDSCTDVIYQAQCLDRGSFIQGACSQQADCQRGCCVCGLTNAPNACIPDIELTGPTGCQEQCLQRPGYSMIGYYPDIGSADCQNECQNLVGEKYTITGTVYETDGTPIPGATITAAGQTAQSSTTSPIGRYTLYEIPTGNILITTTKYTYRTNSTIITIPATTSFNPILQLAEQGQISGKVTSQGTNLKDALVTLTRTSFASALTDTSGNYKFEYIPFGPYTITASKQGYESKTKSTSISIQSPVSSNNNLDLIKLPTGTVSGKTMDQSNRDVPFARIYINDILETHSNENAEYSIVLLTGIYNIYAEKNGYFQSDKQNITIAQGQSYTENLILTSVTSDCATSAPSAHLTANHVKGKKEVYLTWSPQNCNNIEGYLLYREDKGADAFLFIKPSDITHYTDKDVEWQQTYNYKIKVVYNDDEFKISAEEIASITLGDQKCENKFLAEFGRFSEFCEGDYLRKTCDDQNNIKPALLTTATSDDCSDISTDYYCAGPDHNGYTYCRSVSECDPRNQNALPFGLYYNKQDCIGNNNYCYYDYSSTIPDKCYQCSQDLTCFDYQSQDACTEDSCLAAAPNSTCAWQEIQDYSQLGKGICYQTNYKETDQCYRCSSQANLFFNIQCTQDICEKLGNCYLTSEGCTACEDPVCEQLTQEQCGQPITIDNPNCPQTIIPSTSVCGLGKCRWTGTRCIKDGNGDNDADCDDYSGDAKTNCQKDHTSPISQPPIQTGIIHVNENSELAFTITDENPGTLFYCFDQLGNTCCDFNTVGYYTSGDLETPINPYLSGLNDIYNGKGRYNICYYAQDQFKNSEQVKCSTIIADFTAPQITIQYNVIENTTGTYPIVSNLNLYITLDDSATCTDSLKRDNTLIPNKINNQKKQNFSITYQNLDDGYYTYSINCTDDLGNKATNSTTILIDAYRLITINSPIGAVKNPIIFNISTQDNSLGCDLKQNNIQYQGELKNGELTEFWSDPYTLDENIHYNDFTVECKDINYDINGKIDKAHFDFTIDTIGPKTSAIIKSGTKQQTFSITEWETWQQQTSTISLQCNPSLTGGFECDETFYCLTDTTSCTPTTKYTSSISVPETKKIFYYSTDNGNNRETPDKYGVLHIGETLGIKLTNPRFGATNQQTIDLTIELPTDTDECKFSFGDFNYSSLLNKRNYFNKTSEREFKIFNFPQNPTGNQFQNENQILTIYVKCKTKAGYINNDFPAVFDIEYDPTPPNIEQAYFDPQEVTQGNPTILHTETDDKTRCTFKRLKDDHIYKSENYDADPPDFNQTNEKSIGVSTEDDLQTHSYEVQCQNKAEDLSQTKTISFSVDFSAEGTITSLFPEGVINYTRTELKIETNKNANCQYQEEGVWKDFTTGTFDKTVHESPEKTYSEGSYTILINCTIDDTSAKRNARIVFKVDTSPPRMEKVDDNDYTCNPLEIHPQFTANDSISDIEKYAYQLYNTTDGLLINWTETSSNNPKIRTDLEQGKSYYLKVKAMDQAGHLSSELSSNGFTVKNMSALECANDKAPPTVTIETSKHCKNTEIKILCNDASGCGEKLYSLSQINQSCSPSSTYNIPIKITQSSYLCYKVSDQIGNIRKGNQTFIISDQDGDGVFDNCDNCPDTGPGILVTEDGCPPVISDCDCSSGIDLDLDGYGLNCLPIQDIEDSACFDCDDTQRSIHKNCQNGCIYDGDGDSYGFGCDAGPDCNDRDENVHDQIDCASGCIQDTDNDKYGIGCLNGPDCNDLDQSVHSGCSNGCIQDADGDGFGLGCKKGPDCNDFDPSITNIECTSDCTNDKDCDAMPDDWEIANNLDPNDPTDAFLDPDKDNKNNLEEYRDGTDPNISNLLIPEKPRNILKTILIILGLLFILGGISYLMFKKYNLARFFIKKPSPAKPAPSPIKPVYKRPIITHLLKKPGLAELAEEKRRQKAVELIKKRIKEKKDKREKFFEAFGTPKIKTKVTKKEIKPIVKNIKLPKHKHEFENLKKFIETYEPGKKELKSLLKQPGKAEQIFDRLDSIIKKKTKIKKEKLTPEQRKKVKDILYQVLKEKINQQELPEDLEKLRKLSKKGKKK